MRSTCALALYTRQQVAEVLQLGLSTVSRLLKTGELVACRIGRQWRVPAASVEVFLKQNRGEK